MSDGTASVPVTAAIAVSALNDAPLTAADTVSAVEDTALTMQASSLLGNDTDVEGSALSLVAVDGAVGGSVSLNSAGDVVFTPLADFNGTAGFSYTVSDGSAVTQQAVTVAAVNDAPVAGAGQFAMALGVQLSGCCLAAMWMVMG